MADVDTSRTWLQGSRSVLSARYDVLVLDLDGTVYRGSDAVPGSPAIIASLRSRGIHPVFVTNNAARTPAQVVAHLASVGVASVDEEIVTSAQAAATELATMLDRRARVLVVGGDGLRAALREVGLAPIDVADDAAAVVQGWSPDLAWPLLAEGAVALATGVPWVVTNSDLTLPTERGAAPGNGAFVALLGSVTGREPDRVAGKPGPALLLQAAGRFPGFAPLAVGDRLDTDVRGAVAAGMDCLLVLTGVTTVEDLLGAPPDARPTYLSYDLSGLDHKHSAPSPVDGPGRSPRWACGSARATVTEDGALDLTMPGTTVREALDGLRALCAVAWTAADRGIEWTVSDELVERVRPRRPSAAEAGGSASDGSAG
jgi:glycerol-1-phosphatase